MKIHGQTNTRLYKCWANMKNRCNNPNVPNYKHYGGRGIKYIPAWENFISFYEWAIANGYNDNLTIERKNVNGDYSPDNCKWASVKEQNMNKRNTRTLEECKKSAKNFNTRKQWEQGDNTSYQGARYHGWMDECCEHMPTPPNRTEWTIEKCKSYAKKYDTPYEWHKGHAASYAAAYRRKHLGWFDECKEHMT